MFKNRFSLKPRAEDEKKDLVKGLGEFTTVVRGDGKEVIIATSQLVNHLERGFTVKKKEQEKPKATKTK